MDSAACLRQPSVVEKPPPPPTPNPVTDRDLGQLRTSLKRYFRARIKNDGEVEDLVQEVFTRAWRHAEAYDPTRGSVRTWLYQIARHAIIDTRRRAAVRPALALHEPRDEQDPEGLSIERAMLGWQVAAALEKLTPEHRQVIRLAHFQGLSMREIAQRCDLPVGTVKSRTWYALRSLRLVLEEMGVR